jgi:hypothetical protein
MSVGWRRALLALAFVMLAPAVWHVALALPAFGHPTSPYGATVNALLTGARHVTNMVAAVNFDVRGFDTLGEESILIGAVTGACVLLRGSRGHSDVPDRRHAHPVVRHLHGAARHRHAGRRLSRRRHRRVEPDPALSRRRLRGVAAHRAQRRA